MIELCGFSFRYPFASAWALRDVSLRIEAGAFIGIIGPNGAGKSTLCAALAGFVPRLFRGEHSGNVLLDGLEMTTSTPAQTAGRVGLVMQNAMHQLSGAKFTVREEIAFGLENLGVPRDLMQARVEDAMRRLGIIALAGKSPFALSGGQQQRVAIAGLLAMQPSVLIMDEPTAQLDPLGSNEVLQAANALRDSGVTVIVVEHKLAWLAQHASRLFVMSEGAIAIEGEPREVLTSGVLRSIGMRELRYTEAARVAQNRGLWPASCPMPITLADTRAGFEARHAD
jgi:energy-coupling factor transporter ATP-binding protein EcfA2